MRTTPDAVRALAQISSSVEVVGYIEVATNVVDELATCDRQITPERLEIIERYLACHFAYMAGVTTAASVASKSIAGASTSFVRPSSSDSGIKGSPYGMTAIQLDTRRCLVGILEGPIVITWLGTQR